MAYNKRALELGRDRLNVIEDVQLLSGGSTPEAKRARSSPSSPYLVDVGATGAFARARARAPPVPALVPAPAPTPRLRLYWRPPSPPPPRLR